MKIWKNLSMIMTGLLTVALLSCGGSGDGSGSIINGSGGQGQLALSLTDAPISEYKAVYVTIAEIQVHKAGTADGVWKTVLTPNTTYNLLGLVNGNTASLGVADLSTGEYTQMRLILADAPDSNTNILGDPHPYANYIILPDDSVEQLKVPSGFQTGIKLVHNFDVVSGRTVGLILDFDAGSSVVQAGTSGIWLLKPTIKVIDTVDNATLTGTVKYGSSHMLSGVAVSVQIYNASAAIETEKVTTVVSTITDANGDYLMFLPPGTYNLVVVADGYATSSRPITVEYDKEYTENFTLTATTMGILTVALNLPAGTSGDVATIEFRQPPSYDATRQITVKILNYAETGYYPVDLPVGTYTVVATYLDAIITVNDVEVVETGTSVDIDFTP